VLEVDEESWNGQRRDWRSVRSRRRLRGVLMVDAERWRRERRKIRCRSSIKSLEVPTYVIDNR
jgi:hypothetical protein